MPKLNQQRLQLEYDGLLLRWLTRTITDAEIERLLEIERIIFAEFGPLPPKPDGSTD